MYYDALSKAIRYFETQKRLARAIGTGEMRVNYWVKGIRAIPYEDAVKIEKATQKYVHADQLLPETKWIKNYHLKSAYDAYHIKTKDILVEYALAKNKSDITSLKADIQQNSLNRPIAITPDKKLIYGLKRLQACKELGYPIIDAHIIDPEDFLKESPHVYGLIAYATMSERAAIGHILENHLPGMIKNRNFANYVAIKFLERYRNDINLDDMDIYEIVSALMNFDTANTYKSLKKLVQANNLLLTEAVDARRLSIDNALYLLGKSTETQKNILSKDKEDILTSMRQMKYRDKLKVQGNKDL